MSNSGTSFDPRALPRALRLGIVVFAIFVIVAGALWALGAAFGLGRVPAFFLAVCVGPALVAGVTLGWVYSLPAERRQSLIGVGGSSQDGESTGDPADSV
jgi:Kef-type K+ transport system membrane component KefB